MSRGLERKEDKRDMGGGERQERRGKVRGEERGEEKREEKKGCCPPPQKNHKVVWTDAPWGIGPHNFVNLFVVGGNNTARKTNPFF